MKNDKILSALKYGGLCIAVIGALLWYIHIIPKSVQLITFIIGILCYIIGTFGLNNKK